MIQLCRHILPAGRECAQPALHGTLYCRFHTQARKHTSRRRRSPNDFTFTIPFALPEDRAAIQLNLHLIALATIEGRIEPAIARALTYTYRACALNLAKGPLVDADRDTTVRRVILTPDGEEIAQPREALEKGETLAHGPVCPCLKCAEQYRNAPPELHHHDCNCGLCEHTADAVEPSMLNPEMDSQAARPHLASEQPALSLSKGAHLSAEGLSAVADGVPTDRSSSVGWVAEASAAWTASPRAKKHSRRTTL